MKKKGVPFIIWFFLPIGLPLLIFASVCHYVGDIIEAICCCITFNFKEAKKIILEGLSRFKII